MDNYEYFKKAYVITGVHAQYVDDMWVQNKIQPSLEQLLQVAKLLSISPKDLINDINNSSTENV